MADPGSANIGWRVQIFTAFFIPLQVIAVALRFYARWLVVGTRFGVDDGLVFATLLLQLILSAVGVASVPNAGVGRHLDYLEEHDPAKIAAWGKYLLTIATLYSCDVNLPKLAILVLYKRLFPTKLVQYIVYATAAILVGASIANTVTSLAACKPFEANYNPTLPGAKCIDKDKFFNWTSLPNIITDLVLLILPLPIVWNLHNTRRIKVALTFTFLVGSFGLITSILRFRTFFTTNSFGDGTYEAVELIIWTVTEPGIYLISACMLTYRPLLERITKSRLVARLRSSRDRSHGAKGFGHGTNPSRKYANSVPLRKMKKSSGMGFTELDDEETTGIVNIRGAASETDHGSQEGIKVTTDIESHWG